MDGVVVSAARTVIDMERAQQTLDTMEAICYPYVDDQQERRNISTNLRQRTGYYWTPRLPQEIEAEERAKAQQPVITPAMLAAINRAIGHG